MTAGAESATGPSWPRGRTRGRQGTAPRPGGRGAPDKKRRRTHSPPPVDLGAQDTPEPERTVHKRLPPRQDPFRLQGDPTWASRHGRPGRGSLVAAAATFPACASSGGQSAQRVPPADNAATAAAGRLGISTPMYLIHARRPSQPGPRPGRRRARRSRRRGPSLRGLRRQGPARAYGGPRRSAAPADEPRSGPETAARQRGHAPREMRLPGVPDESLPSGPEAVAWTVMR